MSFLCPLYIKGELHERKQWRPFFRRSGPSSYQKVDFQYLNLKNDSFISLSRVSLVVSLLVSAAAARRSCGYRSARTCGSSMLRTRSSMVPRLHAYIIGKNGGKSQFSRGYALYARRRFPAKPRMRPSTIPSGPPSWGPAEGA